MEPRPGFSCIASEAPMNAAARGGARHHRRACHPMSMPDMHAHAADTAETALLLVNLGTPDAPTPRAVRRYLAEFLDDPRVVQLPRWLWWPLLRLVILPLRSSKVARKYAAIWMDSGSPLAVHTRDLAKAVQQRLPQVRVVHAMRYGTPALEQAVAALRNERVRRVLVLPLYPPYSTTTTASVADVVERNRSMPTRLLADY